MAGKEYLSDTNVAIDYIGEDMPEKALYMMDGIINGIFYISVISNKHYDKSSQTNFPGTYQQYPYLSTTTITYYP